MGFDKFHIEANDEAVFHGGRADQGASAARSRGSHALVAVIEHTPLFVVLGIYIALRIVWTGGGMPIDLGLQMYFMSSYAVVCLLAVPIAFGVHAFSVLTTDPSRWVVLQSSTWSSFARQYLTVHRLASVGLAWLALAILTPLFLHWKADIGLAVPFGWLALAILTPLFLHWKADIGLAVPFRWDDRFEQWDRWLHLGRHPWEWIHPLVARPFATQVIDFLYHPVWIMIAKPLVFLGFAWSARRRLVARFLLTYVLLWVILGTGLAYMFASAGPVYFSRVIPHADDAYVALRGYLDTVHQTGGLTARTLEVSLWSDYLAQRWPRVGVSAMPSMHVAVAALIALVAFHFGRRVGLVGVLYLIITVVGSVHLAWHYAIDAYISILAAVGLWWACGRFVDWWFRVAHLDARR